MNLTFLKQHKAQYISEVPYPYYERSWDFTDEQKDKLNNMLEEHRVALRTLGSFNSYAVIEKSYDFKKEGQPGCPEVDKEWKSSPYR